MKPKLVTKHPRSWALSRHARARWPRPGLLLLVFPLLAALACNSALGGASRPTPVLGAPSGMPTLAASLTPLAAARASPPPRFNDTPLPPPTATSPPPPTASPSDTPLPTPTPTVTFTPTPAVPVFDPAALGDNRELASFMLTRRKTITGGKVDDHQYTIGYIQAPYSAYVVEKFTLGDQTGESKTYVIGGAKYDKTAGGDWSYYVQADQGTLDNLKLATDMREFHSTSLIASAQFAGQEDYQGIPANHFTIDQTDLQAGRDTGPNGYRIEKTQGDLYVSQSGNYLLHFHLKLTGKVAQVSSNANYSPGVEEFTEDLSSINQLSTIAVPADFLALKLNLDLGLPLPAGTTFSGVIRYTQGLGLDYYGYHASVTTDDFLAFYKNLAPANGWTVTHIGEVANHYLCDNQVCVMLKKGDEQFIVGTYALDAATGKNLTILVDFDHRHIYHAK